VSEDLPRRGFPAGARQTPVPALFFSDVLPQLEDAAELLVSLYAFFLQSRKPSQARWFTRRELELEAPLQQALRRLAGNGVGALERGLAAATARGTLIAAEPAEGGGAVYTVNVPGAREALTRLGAAVAEQESEPAAAEASAANIFALYEQNVGVLSPLLAEQLKEAEQEYPWPWILAAFREAVALNRRNWRYIERILARWKAEGPDLEAIRRSAAARGRGSLAGRYRRLVQR